MMKRHEIIFMAFLIAFVCLISGSMEAADYLIMKSVVCVQGDRIKLGDIAFIVSQDWNGDETAELVLFEGISPDRGPILVLRPEIEELLESRGFRDLQVGGSESVLVLFSTYLEDREVMRGAIEKLVGDRLSGEGFEHFEVVYRKFPRDIRSMGSGTEFRDLTRKAGLYSGSMLFTLGQYTEGMLEQKYGVSIEVHPFKEVITASSHLPFGKPIHRGDLQLQMRDINSVQGTPYVEAKAVIGKVTKRGLSPGEVITERDVRDNPVVSKGDLVELLYKNGVIEVQGKGIAVESGDVGDRVRVKNIDSGKTIIGRVVGDNLVTVTVN
jgi:flagella basal body P-ring formation protein FlgA